MTERLSGKRRRPALGLSERGRPPRLVRGQSPQHPAERADPDPRLARLGKHSSSLLCRRSRPSQPGEALLGSPALRQPHEPRRALRPIHEGPRSMVPTPGARSVKVAFAGDGSRRDHLRAVIHQEYGRPCVSPAGSNRVQEPRRTHPGRAMCPGKAHVRLSDLRLGYRPPTR
jgi:hypothetical protein